MGTEDNRHQQLHSPHHLHDLPLHIDDSISAMVFSMIGQTTDEEQLRYHLSVSQNSCRFLETQLREFQAQYQILLRTLDASKVSLFKFQYFRVFLAIAKQSENDEGGNAIFTSVFENCGQLHHSWHEYMWFMLLNVEFYHQIL